MQEYSPFTAHEAHATLVDFASLLHAERAEISELMNSGVTPRRILALYAFDIADYEPLIRTFMQETYLERQVRSNANASQPFGTVARYLPAAERKLAREYTRRYDRELARVRSIAAERNLGNSVATALEDREEAIYDVNLTLAILDCLSRQPFAEGINWTEGEREALEAGLPRWRQMTQELLRMLREQEAALGKR